MSGDVAPTIRQALRDAEGVLDEAGVAESVADARLLLAQAMGASPTWVFAHDEQRVPPAAWEAFATLLERRRRREPLQHLLGAQDAVGHLAGRNGDDLLPFVRRQANADVAAGALHQVDRLQSVAGLYDRLSRVFPTHR